MPILDIKVSVCHHLNLVLGSAISRFEFHFSLDGAVNQTRSAHDHGGVGDDVHNPVGNVYPQIGAQGPQTVGDSLHPRVV